MFVCGLFILIQSGQAQLDQERALVKNHNHSESHAFADFQVETLQQKASKKQSISDEEEEEMELQEGEVEDDEDEEDEDDATGAESDEEDSSVAKHATTAASPHTDSLSLPPFKPPAFQSTRRPPVSPKTRTRAFESNNIPQSSSHKATINSTNSKIDVPGNTGSGKKPRRS